MTDDTIRRLTRDELAAAHGYSRTTLERLWADRAANGHPDAHRDGRSLTWDAAEWAEWDRGRQDLITGAEFARLLGHKDSSWVSKAATIPPEGFPSPAEWGDPANRRRPKWRRSEAQHYADHRTPARPPAGAGNRAGSRRGTAYTDDPRLALARQVLADHPGERTARHIERLHQLRHGSSASTWTKILQAARQTEQDQP
ncbi:hypothetical protein ACFQ7B_36860 [Streptomyces erythrochromogenes]|uniref:hypothetical protein n=1 Tax=Streptomyces erythrochromogenes TaxID=285574 RepID=UPI0036CDDF23